MRNFIKLIFILAIVINYQCKTPMNKIYKLNENYIMDGRARQKDFTKNKKFTWFDIGYDNYKTNQSFINSLTPLAKEIKVVVVAGTWCDDTQRELPHFFKVMNEIGISETQIELIMVDKKKQSSAFNISALDVKNIPAFIFYKDGKEQGRIVETAIGGIEEAMMLVFNMM